MECMLQQHKYNELYFNQLDYFFYILRTFYLSNTCRIEQSSNKIVISNIFVSVR